MTAFEPDGVYNSIPFRVLPGSMIEAMMSGGPVKFKNMDQFLASIAGDSPDTSVTHSMMSHGVLDNTNEQNVNVPASAKPLDYYSILLEAITTTKQNSAQLRALVYERARFNLKRDVLFGNSSVDLADALRNINEFELAVARIEASAMDDQLSSAEDEQGKLLGFANVTPINAVQVLPPKASPAALRASKRNSRRGQFRAAPAVTRIRATFAICKQDYRNWPIWHGDHWSRYYYNTMAISKDCTSD